MSSFKHLKLCAALTASLGVTLYGQPCAWAQAPLRLDRPEDRASVRWPIEVSGQAPPSSRVRISMDGQVKATLRVDADGRFSHKIVGLPPKQEILEITAEQLDERDQVRERASIKVSLGAPIATPSQPPQTTPKAPPEQAARPVEEPTRDEDEGSAQAPQTLAPLTPLTPSDAPLEPSAAMPSRRGAGLVPRLISQGLFSALIGGAGAAAGGVVSWRLTQRKLGEGSVVEPFAIAAGAYLGGALLMPLGMYTGGALGEGDGSLLWTYVGGIAATGGAIYLAKRPWVGTTSALSALLILPPLGAWAGYELSSSSSSEGADATLELIPTTDGAHAVFKMSW